LSYNFHNSSFHTCHPYLVSVRIGFDLERCGDGRGLPSRSLRSYASSWSAGLLGLQRGGIFARESARGLAHCAAKKNALERRYLRSKNWRSSEHRLDIGSGGRNEGPVKFAVLGLKAGARPADAYA
jgi:hypothetical protein